MFTYSWSKQGWATRGGAEMTPAPLHSPGGLCWCRELPRYTGCQTHVANPLQGPGAGAVQGAQGCTGLSSELMKCSGSGYLCYSRHLGGRPCGNLCGCPLGGHLCWAQEAEGSSPRAPDNMFKSLEAGEDTVCSGNP